MAHKSKSKSKTKKIVKITELFKPKEKRKRSKSPAPDEMAQTPAETESTSKSDSTEINKTTEKSESEFCESSGDEEFDHKSYDPRKFGKNVEERYENLRPEYCLRFRKNAQEKVLTRFEGRQMGLNNVDNTPNFYYNQKTKSMRCFSCDVFNKKSPNGKYFSLRNYRNQKQTWEIHEKSKHHQDATTQWGNSGFFHMETRKIDFLNRQ